MLSDLLSDIDDGLVRGTSMLDSGDCDDDKALLLLSTLKPTKSALITTSEATNAFVVQPLEGFLILGTAIA